MNGYRRPRVITTWRAIYIVTKIWKRDHWQNESYTSADSSRRKPSIAAALIATHFLLARPRQNALPSTDPIASHTSFPWKAVKA